MILSVPKLKGVAVKSSGLPWLLTALFLGIFLLFKPDYLNTGDLYFWTGLLALPVSYNIRKGERSRRFFWVALAFGLLSIPFPATIGVYCMLVFSILFFLEQLEGKTNFLFTIHLLLLSPLFGYFNSLVSFPIRLGLSGAAGSMLEVAGFNVQLSGNLIKLDGTNFLVDSACSGLFMLRYSFLFAVIILAYFQSRGKSWKLREMSLLFAALFLLNILGNLIRIVLLIVFKVMPDFWFHDVLGLFIFLIYSLLPFYFLAKYRAKKNPSLPSTLQKTRDLSPLLFFAAVGLLLLTFGAACFQNSKRLEKEVVLNEATRLIYGAEKINGNVYKLSTAGALIYLKPSVEAYHADHNPLICWSGSGYEFKHISTTTLAGLEVSVAELTKGEDRLYTMWWFDSGHHQTGSQWDWRRRTLMNKEPFYLVNITAASMETLRKEALDLLEKGIIDERF